MSSVTLSYVIRHDGKVGLACFVCHPSRIVRYQFEISLLAVGIFLEAQIISSVKTEKDFKRDG